MSTYQRSNQLAKEGTPQNTVGNTTMTLIRITRKFWIFENNWKTRTIKEAIYSEENKHRISRISFKLPAIWKRIVQKNKEKKSNRQTSTTKNTSPSKLSPDTSAMQTNQSAMTTEHFDPTAGT